MRAMSELKPVDPRWLAARQRLQGRYEDLSELVDASRLSYLRGPIQHFSEDEFANIWAQAVADPNRPQHAQHSVYIHVPFCKSICSFCNYERLRSSSPSELSLYTEQILKQISHIAPHTQHLEFSSIYFGGGTPSVLPAAMLDEIMSALDLNFKFHPDNGRHMEFDPAVMNAVPL